MDGPMNTAILGARGEGLSFIVLSKGVRHSYIPEKAHRNPRPV